MTDDEQAEVVMDFMRGAIAHYAKKGSEVERGSDGDIACERVIVTMSALLYGATIKPGGVHILLALGRGSEGRSAEAIALGIGAISMAAPENDA